MSDFYCTRCQTTQETVFALLNGETIELPPLGMVRNPHLTECCKDSWEPMPKRGREMWRIATIEGFVAKAASGARLSTLGTPISKDFRNARWFTERRFAELWIREHPLERGLLHPRIEELEIS